MPTDEDTLAHPEQPRFLLSAWLWAVVLFVFFGAIVAITFGTMPRGSTYEEERAKNRTEKLKTAREEWTKASEGYSWVDKAKGVARIPIARAMELELGELQAKKPEPAGPIATPAPAEAPANATGAAQPANPPVTGAPPQGTPKPSSISGPNSEAHGQPAAAVNPPNAPAGTQPGVSATPAAGPNSRSEVAPVSPSAAPIQHSVGMPLPARGATQPAASPKPTSSPR